MYVPADAPVRAWKDAIRVAARNELRRSGLEAPFAAEGPVRVTVTFRFCQGTKRQRNRWHTSRPDVDNVVKALCDALNGIAWTDDAQVAEIRASKEWAPRANTSATVEPIG